MDWDLEYTDRVPADSASSAVRNLNDYEIMNRKLRVDFSNDSDGGDDNNVCKLSSDYSSHFLTKTGTNPKQ